MSRRATATEVHAPRCASLAAAQHPTLIACPKMDKYDLDIFWRQQDTVAHSATSGDETFECNPGPCPPTSGGHPANDTAGHCKASRRYRAAGRRQRLLLPSPGSWRSGSTHLAPPPPPPPSGARNRSVHLRGRGACCDRVCRADRVDGDRLGACVVDDGMLDRHERRAGEPFHFVRHAASSSADGESGHSRPAVPTHCAVMSIG